MALSSVARNCLFNACNGIKYNLNKLGAASLVARRWNSSAQPEDQTQAGTTTVCTKFVNRNPRSMELTGLAWKRRGWNLQYPRRDFYHRVVLVSTNRNTEAYVEHSSGKVVLTCSTKELAIRKHLYKNVDLSAFSNLGKILAQRCIESGLGNVTILEWPNAEQSEKFQTFKQALIDGGLELTEPEEVVAPYMPGIDYEDEEKVDELITRQTKVWALGKKSLLIRWKNLRKSNVKRRPIALPRDTAMPSYTYLS